MISMLANDIKEKIIGLINEKSYKPMKIEEFSNIFVENIKDLEMFNLVLKELEDNGDLFINKKGKIGSLKNYSMEKGSFCATKKGFAFVKFDDQEEDIFIHEEDKNGAFDGDTVLVKITQQAQSGRKSEGVIIKILNRKNEKIVGLFKSSNSFGFVIPDNKKLDQDVFIPKRYFSGAKDNDKVVCQIDLWPEKGRKAEGRILEVIGQSGERYVEIDSIVKSHGLKEEFPQRVKKRVKTISDHVNPEEINNRVDFRNELIYTIDGDDSKDFDDAVGVEKLANGNYRLGVHIADVTHYVTENSPLDKEALERATSVYLVDKVIPMLPKELSNGICSLNPGVDRLTLSCIMEVNSKTGKVENYNIVKSVINSKARMTYTEVSDLLENDDPQMKIKYKDFIENLENARDLAAILTKKREKRGAIDFDFPESKIVLDKAGYPVDIKEYERRVSNKMIEEFMLLANETVAQDFFWKELPFVYRVHEEPDQEKVERLRNFISEYGYRLNMSKGGLAPRDLQRVLGQIDDREAKQAIGTIMLRTLRQARYSPECLGHFGLAAKYYTHFTSPIRRYPDLQIHRIIKEGIDGKLNHKRIKHYTDILEGVSNQSSIREREAELIEREVDDYYKAVYMSDFIGEKFEGHISGITSFGLFVELENGVEGLIRLINLADYFEYNERSMTLVGECSNTVLKLGQKVFVKVSNVDIAMREIDFDL